MSHLCLMTSLALAALPNRNFWLGQQTRFTSMFLAWLMVVLWMYGRPLSAQPTPPSFSAHVVTLDERNLSNVAALVAQADAVEVNCTREELEAQPDAFKALDQWVRESGGILLLHNDAAQLFGYRTIEARQRTHAMAGQLFGRARSALYFGQHPLLWGGLSHSLTGTTFGGMGVKVVFYQMAPGDALPLAHCDGVPILRVADITQPEVPQPTNDNYPSILCAQEFRMPWTVDVCHTTHDDWPILIPYAAAMAPWGRGWALMTPRKIETQRGDGAQFLKNLDNMIVGLRRTHQWQGLPTAPLERAFDRVNHGRRVNWARVASEIRNAMQSSSSDWTDEEVQAMYARDMDQTLAAEDVKRGFNTKRWSNTNQRTYYMAIASAVESRKRKRLLAQAQSKFKLLVTPQEVDELLETLDTAAIAQQKWGKPDEKLSPGDELGEDTTVRAGGAKFDLKDAPTPDADDTDTTATNEVKTGGETPAGTGMNVSDSEKRSPSYRHVVGCAFWFSDRIRMNSDTNHVDRQDWLFKMRGYDLNRDAAWLWRGLLSMGECENWEEHSYARRIYINDALASWQRALQAHLEAVGDSEDSSTPNNDKSHSNIFNTSLTPSSRSNSNTPSLYDGSPSVPANDESQVKGISGTDENNTNQNDNSATGERDTQWQAPKAQLKGEMAGIPCVLIARWIQEGFKARAIILSEPPLGGLYVADLRLHDIRIKGESINTETLITPRLSEANSMPYPGEGTSVADTPLSHLRGGVWMWFPYPGGGAEPSHMVRHGFLENNFSAYNVIAKLLGRHRDALGKLDTSGIAPVCDDFRTNWTDQWARVLAYHSSCRELGWGSDSLDMLLFPGAGAARAFRQAATRVGQLQNSELPADGSFDGTGTLKDVMNISPIVSPLGVSRTLMLQAATEGRVVGTRFIIPTPPLKGNSGERAMIRRGVALPAILARLQGQALLNTITEGGTQPPSWMSEGVINLCRLYTATVLTNEYHPAATFLGIGGDGGEARRKGQRPKGIPSESASWWILKERSILDNVYSGSNAPEVDDPGSMWWHSDQEYFRSAAEIVLIDNPAQQASTRTIKALYAKYGRGGVTEIFQRLGSGQSVDEAFEGVTDMTEKECVADLAEN